MLSGFFFSAYFLAKISPRKRWGVMANLQKEQIRCPRHSSQMCRRKSTGHPGQGPFPVPPRHFPHNWGVYPKLYLWVGGGQNSPVWKTYFCFFLNFFKLYMFTVHNDGFIIPLSYMYVVHFDHAHAAGFCPSSFEITSLPFFPPDFFFFLKPRFS